MGRVPIQNATPLYPEPQPQPQAFPYPPPPQGAPQNNTYHPQPHQSPRPFAAGETVLQRLGAPWSTDLFACAEDPHNALITAIFPCITFGQLAEILDNGTTTCVTSGIVYAAAPCIQSRRYRTKLRLRFGLMEAPAADWVVHFAFETCALCQEYRELARRGIDPALGYRGNLEKLQGSRHTAILMAPPQNQVMNYNAGPALP